MRKRNNLPLRKEDATLWWDPEVQLHEERRFAANYGKDLAAHRCRVPFIDPRRSS